MKGIQLDLLSTLLQQPTPQVRKLVDDQVNITLAEFRKHFPNLTTPTISYDLVGTTAGRANASTVWLNLGMLNDPTIQQTMLTNTLPHELAHVVVRQIWPDAKSHGIEWRSMMRLIGLTPERCHNYDITNHKARDRKRMPRPYIYKCHCQVHRLTKIVHGRIKQGKRYHCANCRSDLVFFKYEGDK